MAQTVTETAAPTATKVSALRRLPHHAFPVADQEVTRQFMEDVLGIPLKATWCERSGARCRRPGSRGDAG